MSLLLILICITFVQGKALVRFETDTQQVAANCYMDKLLANIRTGMEIFDPAVLPPKQGGNIDGDIYMFYNTSVLGLSTLYTVGQTRVSNLDDDLLISAHVQSAPLKIESRLFVEADLTRESTTGIVTGEMKPQELNIVVRVTQEGAVLYKYIAENAGLINKGSFFGRQMAALEPIIHEAIDFAFHTSYSFEVIDVIGQGLRSLVETKIKQSKFVPPVNY